MQNQSILALDVGEKRIGVARADVALRFANPLTTLEHTAVIWDDLEQLISREQAVALVVGLPRGLDGQETAQTATIAAFIAQLREKFTVPVYEQDEAATSLQAESELEKRGKPYQKGDIDALAATYILEDYLANHEAPHA